MMKLKLGQNQWDLDRVLPVTHKVSSQYFINVPETTLANFRHLLSRDVFSEADSAVLYDYLMARPEELSPGFFSMLNLWLSDEKKHYEALRRVYHMLAGVSFAEMDRLFAARTHETTPIAMVLKDEFTILVTMMFDEIGSVYSYRRDLVEYYCHFGPEIQKIGHHLVRDEGMHFSNAAELLLFYHADRLGEVKELLHAISELEGQLGTYYKSFFLDHAQETFRFPPHFNQVIIQVILARLGLGQPPKQSELQTLWQWVPPQEQAIKRTASKSYP
jgi:hypothetical protein